MKNAVKYLSSDELLKQTIKLASEERRITLELIEYLKEIDSRMLYAELGFGSLFEFTTKHLGLSEGSAHRRISAMRLIRDVPEVKEKIESGELTVTNAAKIQVALKTTKTITSVETKAEIVNACLNQSQIQCDQVLFEKIPELSEKLPTERIRLIDSEKFEIKLILTKELHQKIEKLNALISHSNPEQKILNVIERLVDEELKRREFSLQKNSSQKNRSLVENQEDSIVPDLLLEDQKLNKERNGRTESTVSTAEENKILHSSKVIYSVHKPPQQSEDKIISLVQNSQSIPLKVRREVWLRADSKCEYLNCTSTYQLQIDHRLPKALGGDHNLENLRLLCRTHNLYEAKRLLGDEKIDKHIA